MTKQGRPSKTARARTSSRVSQTSRKQRSGRHAAKAAATHTFRVAHFMAAVVMVWLSLAIWVLAPPKPATAAVQGYPWYYEEERFLQIINSYRAGVGDGSLPMLSNSDCLTRAAHDWAKQMAASNSLVHSPDGFISGYCGIGGHAENALVDTNVLEPVAQRAFNTWLNSPWHQLNMRTDYTHTGIAFYFDETHAKIWGVQMFIQCTPGNCGPAITNAPNNIQTNAAVCREVSIPSTLSAGQAFKPLVIWTNTGTSAWRFTYKVASVNNVWGQTRLDFQSFGSSEHVNPGWAAGIYSHTFTAPATPGTYEFSLQPTNGSGAVFGARCGNTITVTGSSSKTATGSKSSAKPGQSSTTETGSDPDHPADSQEPSKQSDSQGSPTGKASDSKKAVVSAPEDSTPLKQQTSIVAKLQSASLPVKASIAGMTAVVVFAFILFHTRLFSLLHKVVAAAFRIVKRK